MVSDIAISMLTKKDWRTSLLGLRNQLSHSRELTGKLSLNVMSELTVLKPRSVGAYWPIRSEPNFIKELEKWARANDVVLYLPETQEEKMIYRRWDSNEALEKDCAGIWCSKGEVALMSPEVILAPCVGYSKSCYRLGYGGGFFDRYLGGCISIKPKVVGVCFDDLLVPDDLFESHDVMLDVVITERRKLRIK